MNVILLEKIGRLGNLGDQVKVKPGFARNYLLPQGKAVKATEENVKQFEARRAELEKAAQEVLQAAQARADVMAGMAVTIAARAADEGRLYGSIGPREVVIALEKMGTKVQKSEVHLPNGPLHTLGEHEVKVQLHSDVSVTVKVNIIPEA